MKIEARSWKPQDLLNDLRELIDEEPDKYLNTRRTTLCMALDYLKEHFAGLDNEPLTLEELRKMDGEPVWLVGENLARYDIFCGETTDHIVQFYKEALPTWAYGRTWRAYRRKLCETGTWINVETQLPEPGKEVLLLAHGWEGRLHYIGKLAPSPAQEGFFGVSKASDWTIWGWSYFREPKVTHWMPLPEPPESHETEEKQHENR